jgi:hypothetical protein
MLPMELGCLSAFTTPWPLGLIMTSVDFGTPPAASPESGVRPVGSSEGKMTPMMPWTLLVMACLAMSGCYSGDATHRLYFIAADFLEVPPSHSINWTEVNPADRPEELPQLFRKTYAAYVDPNPTMGSDVEISKSRSAEVQQFFETEWVRQTLQPIPSDLIFPMLYEGQYYDVYRYGSG